ncbi:hypothetical protein quinque_004565 [Culex quinquefasciatus]
MNVLEYSLQIIQYMMDDHVGTFECVFFDAVPKNPYDNVLSELLKSSQLLYTTKYVVQGTFRSEHLPKNPSLLVIHPGSKTDLWPYLTSHDIFRFLYLFNPATTVFVFWNIFSVDVFTNLRWALVEAHYSNVLFFDTEDSTVVLSSLKDYAMLDGLAFKSCGNDKAVMCTVFGLGV